MERFSIDSCVRGYHVYSSIWEASVGELLPCKQEDGTVSILSLLILFTTPTNTSNFRDCGVNYENNENWHPTKITRFTVFMVYTYIHVNGAHVQTEHTKVLCHNIDTL